MYVLYSCILRKPWFYELTTPHPTHPPTFLGDVPGGDPLGTPLRLARNRLADTTQGRENSKFQYAQYGNSPFEIPLFPTPHGSRQRALTYHYNYNYYTPRRMHLLTYVQLPSPRQPCTVRTNSRLLLTCYTTVCCMALTVKMHFLWMYARHCARVARVCYLHFIPVYHKVQYPYRRCITGLGALL
jgi:hypothetical protein